MLRGDVTLEFKEFPIVEVCCEVGFEPIAGVDAMLVGKYWGLHKERFGFPHREIGARGSLGGATFHAWLVSESREFALELEASRFAVYWRKRENTYPHFGDIDGEEGLLSMALRELDEYRRFCTSSLNSPLASAIPKASLEPRRLELVKIDHLIGGENFADFDELARAVPVVSTLASILKPRRAGAAARPEIDVRSHERRDDHDLSFRLSTLDDRPTLSIAIETRVSRAFRVSAENAAKELIAPFTQMNAIANEVFDAAMGGAGGSAIPAPAPSLRSSG